jgi:hypothetical protein
MTELLRFYEDLGIIPNRGTAMENNDNLLQGQQFMEHRRYNKRHVKPYEGFTMPNTTDKCSTNDDCKNGICDPTKLKCIYPCKNDSQCAPNKMCDKLKDYNFNICIDKTADVAPPAATTAPPAAPAPATAPATATATAPATATTTANNNVTGANINNGKGQKLSSSSIDDNGINLDATTFQPINNGSSKTIEGRRDHSILETRSIKYHYIAWIFFAIFIIWAIFSISTFSFSGVNLSSEFQPAQNESNVFSMIMMIILIVIVFVIFSQFNSSSIKTTVSIYDNSNKKIDNDNDKGKNSNSKK